MLLAESWGTPRSGMMAQGLLPATIPGSPEPLAHGSSGDTQSLGDLDLLPTLLLQLEGPHSSALEPGLGFGCSAHAPSVSKSSSMFINLQSSQ